MESTLYHDEDAGEHTLFVIDFRDLQGDQLVAAFREVAEYVQTQPPGSLRSMTLAHGIEYSPSSMKAAIALARGNKVYMQKSAIVGLDHLTSLVNIINRLAGRAIRAFQDEEAARLWLLSED